MPIMQSALDPCSPDNCTPINQWTAWSRLYGRLFQNAYVRGACFEPGTKTYDAVFFNTATNTWWRSQATKEGEEAEDNIRRHVHGIARPDLNAVQVMGFVEGCYQFAKLGDAYVGSSTPGILTATETDLPAGYALKVNGFLLTGWLSLAAKVIGADPDIIDQIINNFFENLTEEQYNEFIENFITNMTEEQWATFIENIFNNPEFEVKFQEFVENYFGTEAGSDSIRALINAWINQIHNPAYGIDDFPKMLKAIEDLLAWKESGGGGSTTPEEGTMICASSNLMYIATNKTNVYKPGRKIRITYNDNTVDVGYVVQSWYESSEDRTYIEVGGMTLVCSKGFKLVEVGLDNDLVPVDNHQALVDVFMVDDPNVASPTAPRHVTQPEWDDVTTHRRNTINRATDVSYGHMRYATAAELANGTALVGIDAAALKAVTDAQAVKDAAQDAKDASQDTAIQNAQARADSAYALALTAGAAQFGQYQSTTLGYVIEKKTGATTCFALSGELEGDTGTGIGIVTRCADGDTDTGSGNKLLAGHWVSRIAATDPQDIIFFQL